MQLPYKACIIPYMAIRTETLLMILISLRSCPPPHITSEASTTIGSELGLRNYRPTQPPYGHVFHNFLFPTVPTTVSE